MGDRSTAIIASFNGGEVSPRLRGRVDQGLYPISCETMDGWLPLIQGCAVTAPGTIFVEKAAGPCRLIPFEYNVTEGYVIEASAGRLRFYTNDVRIETAPGVPYEIAHSYTIDQLRSLDFQQSADVLYLVGGGAPMRKLSRTGAESFTLADLTLRGGPIGDGNIDEGVTISASAATGAVTLTATSALFAAGDVGGLIEIEASDFSDIAAWEPGIEVTTGAKRAFGGKVYIYSGGGSGRTGTVAPFHDSGTEWDGSGTGTDINGKGPYGVPWTFLYGRFGLVRITAFTNATTVSATVLKPLADSVVSEGSWRWAFGVFSARRGWPDSVCIWNECLVLTKDNTAYVSVVGDYENFARRDASGDFQRDLAGSFTLPDPARINWARADRLLLLGTERAEYTVERVLTQTEAAGPPIFDVRLQSSNGSARARPVQADGRVLFVQRALRKLMEMAYSIQTDRYDAPDLTRLADHIGARGFVELAWQQEPERILWAAQADGRLAALTYSPGQQVTGWSTRRLGGGMAARSLCRITEPSGQRDQIWIAAELGADTLILRMAPIWQQGDDPLGAMLVDAGLSYSGAPVAAGVGAAHLAGQVVQVLADGKPHPDITIGPAGGWAISYPAARVTLGLAFPARLKPMPLEAGASEGTAQGKIKRIAALTLRVLEAQGLRVQVQDGELFPIETRIPADPMDAAVPLFTGDLPIETIGDFDREGGIVIERFQPVPATVTALIAAVEVGEA
ncbi:hypothetical protein ACMT1E_04335 [Sphingomonas flavalba]|uniref:hypothetical protein n=1 Tax=Sphingomonas flavalba TaxID=2559804 RepID=UPI0039DF53FA